MMMLVASILPKKRRKTPELKFLAVLRMDTFQAIPGTYSILLQGGALPVCSSRSM